MEFAGSQLAELMRSVPSGEGAAAEQTNLCLEARVTAERQAAYDARIGEPVDWSAWREAHKRYVQEDVRRRRPLSAAFSGGDALRPELEGNQEIYRVERIDSMLRRYTVDAGVPVGVEQIREWISSRDGADAGVRTPAGAALEDLTDFLNDDHADGRPRFVTFVAEFPGLETRSDWPETICERCGLAHHCTGTPVTLALFRYSVEDVLTTYRKTDAAAAVFAVPTVLDQPMSNVYFSGPASLHVGHAVGLAPRLDCAHLAAELIHARIAYRAEHWAAVSTLIGDRVSSEEIDRLRVAHLDCLRRTPGNADYGAHCVD